MSEVGALEPGVVDLIAARVLNPPEFPTPLPDRPSLAAAAAAELDKREDQAHRPDDVADPAHKLVRHSRCFAQQKTRQTGGSRERPRSLYKDEARQSLRRAQFSNSNFRVQ